MEFIQKHRENISTLALCISILCFVPFAFSLPIVFGMSDIHSSNDIVANMSILIEIISILVATITVY